MNILYVLQSVTHPTARGELRHYHFLRYLARHHDITLVALGAGDVPPQALDELGRCTKRVVIVDAMLPPRPVRDHLLQGVRRRVQKVRLFRRGIAEVGRRIRLLISSGRFHLLLLSGSDLHPVVEGITGIPVVVDWCDADSLRLRTGLRYARALEWPWRYWRYRQVRRTERRLLSSVTHATFISPRDRHAAGGTAHNATVIPNGCDLTYWARHREGGDHRIVFTGVMDYPPNADAAAYLVREILPRVRRCLPNVEVVIAGRNPLPDLEALARKQPGVLVTGGVPDLRPYLEDATAFVAPLRFASGMQNKILEAMAMELPVVTTPIAADGIRITEHEEPPVLVADTAGELAAHIVRLCSDRQTGRHIGVEGRRYVGRHCDWERSAQMLDRVCRQAVRAHAARASGPISRGTVGGRYPPGTPVPFVRVSDRTGDAAPPLCGGSTTLETPAGDESHVDVAREPIRGSSLMLAGRLISLGLMCAVQVLIVRHLSRVDYGAWTYALSVVMLLQSVAALGLDRSITRFVSIYREHGDHQRLRGVVLLLVTVVAVSGTTLPLLLAGFPSEIGRLTHIPPDALALLSIVVFLVPLEALDLFFIGLFACLGQARAIVIRRHMLTPGLKLAAVVTLVALDADVTFLAYGYLVASVAGILLYGPLIARSFRQMGLIGRSQTKGIDVPAREVFAFTLPLLTADLAGAVMGSAGALTLGVFSTLDQVALFTAAVPLAVLNQTVARNFTVLYTPAIARLFARQDAEGINAMYWRTAVWVAVLTFPVFVVTFSAAGSILHLLYGTRYTDAAMLLSLLAVGEYVNVALGLSGLTLRLLNNVGYSIAINVVAAAAAVVGNLVLVPRFGALGAALATSGTLVLHCALKQAGLAMTTGVRPFDPQFASLYAVIGLCAGTVVLGQWMLPDSPATLMMLALAASFLLLVATRHTLKVAETFPEVRRVPLLRTLFA